MTRADLVAALALTAAAAFVPISSSSAHPRDRAIASVLISGELQVSFEGRGVRGNTAMTYSLSANATVEYFCADTFWGLTSTACALQGHNRQGRNGEHASRRSDCHRDSGHRIGPQASIGGTASGDESSTTDRSACSLSKDEHPRQRWWRYRRTSSRSGSALRSSVFLKQIGKPRPGHLNGLSPVPWPPINGARADLESRNSSSIRTVISMSTVPD
jgi:hypothetical protein